MNVAVVIPARYASQRLPAKPLLRETGKYLIQHAYERAKESRRASAVIVATDDARIFDAVRGFGGDARMTREDHASGTDRIAEVAESLAADVVINLQGDEPLFDPHDLDALAQALIDDPALGMATLATPFRDAAAFRNPNFVKVVCDDAGRALYFSRSPIPYCRDGDPDFVAAPHRYLQHLGVYAYRRETLLALAKAPPHPLEQVEKLEQLRALAHGIGIRVGVIPHAHRGVDTPEDYAAFVAAWTARSATPAGPEGDATAGSAIISISHHPHREPVRTMSKHIFVTGGVVSSLGKGLTSASIGLLLERRGLKVRMQKFDPYLNVDPGTMSPYQHGEVYVLDDGAECDLDLGHYERFTNARLDRDCNFTTGRIYSTIIDKERRGEFRGKTVQVIPHVTDEIKGCIRKLATPDVDVVITEIGGTVGDIEAAPYFEAIRQYALDAGKTNCLFIHLTLVPYLKAAGELKTKPTQHSVRELREIGIQPDILILRTERPIPKDEFDKIALMCNVERRAVIEEMDREYSIYEVPISLSENKIDEIIVDQLHLKAEPLEFSDWRLMVDRIREVKQHPERHPEVRIAVVGKYVKHRDAYKSVYESLDHAGIAHRARLHVERIESELVEELGAAHVLEGYDGVLVPGGFDKRGILGKVDAIRHARENGVPFFGICLGLQCATIEYARNVLGHADANSTEFDPTTPHPVVALLDSQHKVTYVGGTMRKGAYDCRIEPGTRAAAAYQSESVSERHRHRYEVNNDFRKALEGAGLVVSGTTMDGGLVEVIELPGHPWFLAVQCHPEFQSKPTAAHPLFRDFVGAAVQHKAKG